VLYLKVHHLIFLPMKTKSLLLTSIASFLFSVAAHGQWTRVSNGLPQDQTVLSLSAINSTLFAGTNHGGYKSTDLGMTWTLCTHFPIHNFSESNDSVTYIKMVAAGGNLYAIIQGGSGMMLLSTDEGGSWDWDTLGFLVPNLGRPNVDAILSDGATTILGTDLGIFLSTQAGGTWTRSNAGFKTFSRVKSLASIGSTIIAGTVFDGNYRSSDGGNTWTSSNDGQYGADILTARDSLLVFVYGPYVGVSFDNGQHWDKALTGLATSNTIHSVVTMGSTIFVGTQDSGVFLSNDIGQHWSEAHAGLEHGWVNALAVCGGFMFAGTQTGGGTYPSDQGVWRRPLSDFAVAGVSKERSTSIELSPNPTSDFVNISGMATPAHITVMNLLGKSVLEMSSSNTHTILDLTSLAAGAYWVRVSSEGSVIARTVIRE
jgi:hypothetical protein